MIFPAIDLRNGQSVRLYQGDYNKETVINSDPISQAQQIQAAGLTHLHLVDLDGAKSGKPINLDIITALRQNTQLFIELGGGIRSLAQIKQYLSLGINRVIIGSAALTHPELVTEAVAQFGAESIVVGVDGRQEQVATDGWLTASSTTFSEIIQAMQAVGVINFIVTDIERDGTLSGPNIALLSRLQQKFPETNIIASGGISTITDIEDLQTAGIKDIIVGRALYDGNVTLSALKEVMK
ncbi:1-(5-phosphoribosyl)-5-[(5-phosphoribosylamino)methylideneamino]imidazole-4-carboxamide isomerase [Leuconostoc falkenbergense]|jgi:phosphoribosylformimino-5-aminoimidazole carboxamide ribotide isomerase|uniref:1-(5-phosphoribosyl)-5-[(5-phosphoribosylamino)methylideneamino] imidazole-4-carboxamide isomerase n=2 Tax=Leuconostoc TaxID=1243 RepID=A0A9X3IPK9_9LACO|nr:MULTISPECIES: 1-(5-phosphoribosyl)-5-[(5-phosphoribosylamino)methylideneamino]imidazole-4-carboxamide isomerase [Leuconostoc]MCT4378465.1 1-(5-phosphoribosyl)-5-[(5-phosphoribosylamino)methylideneamino]imidazole-4-carboxamide isomerase [Leuconostoc falkenbergense]MCT4389854.1 1-(5-phosphoribosyl)-5-[(5-phosphoribosylamino)methylideneamino]imidazole-4-carboxamide isomerase [Leuconostoc falkenbergense]MCT4410200.1 1-(5-phosphoribosyl)-5-[(5-phosphoribosylamino)methylideneamino]imidazole-4-carbo